MIRRSQAEKREIIHLVEHSALSVKETLDELQVPRSTFYRWYKQYLEEGEEGLVDHRPNLHQICPSWRMGQVNRIPQEVKQQVVELALEHPDRSPRQIAWLFTDEKGYFISESSTYRILKGFDLVESTAFRVMSAAEKYKHPTKRIHELWQTDFTYFKIQGWGWYYLSTVLDDFSRYILAWKLTPTMSTTDVQDTLLMALASTGLDHALVAHRPRLLSDNGSCYVSGELRSFLQHRHIEHTRSAPYHPMTQGKIERYHRSMKNIVNLQNYYLPIELETEIASFVNYYNHQRYHESLDNLTPADVYFGRAKEVLTKRDQVKKQKMQQRRLQNLQWPEEPFRFLEDMLILKSALAGAFVYKLTARSIVQHKCNLQLDTVFDNVAVLVDLHILVLDPGGPDIPDRFHCSGNTLLEGIVKALGGGSLDLGNTCYSHGKLLSCLGKVGNV